MLEEIFVLKSIFLLERETEFAVTKSKFPARLAEYYLIQFQLVGLVEYVGEETIDGKVLCELFLENEKIVDIVENAVEI